ncbi:hypothetical protein EHQ76_07160 [Leptospira barantonii]|uniref:Uncharacterized protein n=1 Tax=Leptospira barantonii TaxID=2023184 RepID=A0A5F2BGY0_9LEPT|nr:hypothetical protein [Leptospira barantonii]TGM04819.1 hypothetical protein EHQ76_07160 [Leptospira barantonii]
MIKDKKIMIKNSKVMLIVAILVLVTSNCNVIGYKGMLGSEAKEKYFSALLPLVAIQKNTESYTSTLIIETSLFKNDVYYLESDVENCIEIATVSILAGSYADPFGFSYRCKMREIGYFK